MAGTLVELGERGTEIGGETRIGRHLGKTTRDLSESLGPTRRRVSHHSHILALVTEVLSKCDTGVNGSLSGCDRHVRGVGDEASTLHDIVHATIDLSLKLGEVIQYLSHLITALTASDIDDTVRVGVLGEGLGDTGLAAAEGAWNSASTALNSGEKSVEDALSRRQGVHGSELLSTGSGRTHRPEMRHAELDALALGGLDDGNTLCHVVLTLGHNLNDCTTALRRGHDQMLMEKIILEHMTNLISTGDDGTWAFLVVGNEGVEAVLVEGGEIDTTRHEDGLRDLGNRLKWSLNTIKDSLENTCTQEL